MVTLRNCWLAICITQWCVVNILFFNVTTENIERHQDFMHFNVGAGPCVNMYVFCSAGQIRQFLCKASLRGRLL